jgi:predicted RNA-binding protein YlxR (DUF448 family)
VKTRHVPLRQCVVCKRRIEKHKLTRFVRSGEQWQADPGGRGTGRGAYLCSPECAQAVKKNKRYRALGALMT